MTAFPFDIVGFDLDGTLVDTSGDLTVAVNHALAAGGHPPLAPAAVRTMIGGGAKHMLAQALDAAGGVDRDQFRRLYRIMLDHYGAHIADHSRPYPGATALLDRLDALGVHSAIVTNKFEAFALKLLDALGFGDRFACVIGGDTLGPGNAKPSPAPIVAMIARCGGGRAAFVGDSIYDAMAARAAGISFVTAGYGFLLHPVAELDADAAIDRLDDLVPALERIGRLG